MEDFREGGVQDQGNALRQGSGKFHFQSAVSFSLGIEGIVRIHLQDVQTITFGHKMAAPRWPPGLQVGCQHHPPTSAFVQFRCFCCLYTGHAHSNQSSITL